MSIIRSFAATVTAVAALATLAAVPTAGPALLDEPTQVLGWWDTHGTAAAAIGLVHLVALAVAAYVAVVLVAVTMAAILRLPRAAVGAARFVPGSIRRHLVVGVVAGALLSPATVGAQEAIVVVDVGADTPTATPITVVDLGEVGTGEEPKPDEPSRTPEPASTFRESFRGVPVAPTPDAWLVESGDNLWSIAAAVVDEHHEGPVDEAIVASYWRTLIAANTDALADPDLIHPGQVLNLPPVVTAGS